MISCRQDEDKINSLLLAFSQPIDKLQRPVKHVETDNEER
jgi:hypothetical protein